MVGKQMQEMFPNMRPGDELFFHHSIEGSVLSEAEKKVIVPVITWHIHDNEYSDVPDFIYYMVREDFIYGFRTAADGEVTMHPDMCFAFASTEEADNRDVKQVGSLLLFENFKEERKDIEKRIAAMKRECETHTDRAPLIMPEMEKLTRSLNKKRAGTFTPVFVGENVRRDFLPIELDTSWMLFYEFLGSKSTVPQVTTIEIDDAIFYVLRKDYMLCAIKPKKVFPRVLSLDQIYKEHERIRNEELKKLKKESRLAPGLLSEVKE
jgi:hypothetical protein